MDLSLRRSLVQLKFVDVTRIKNVLLMEPSREENAHENTEFLSAGDRRKNTELDT